MPTCAGVVATIASGATWSVKKRPSSSSSSWNRIRASHPSNVSSCVRAAMSCQRTVTVAGNRAAPTRYDQTRS
jgi:hypothetical protein